MDFQLQAFSMISPRSYPLNGDQVAYLLPKRDENSLQDAVEKVRELIRHQNIRGHGSLEKLIIIDAIQRLGVEHYFKAEIHAVLEEQYAKFSSWQENNGFDDDGLHETALRFRLLRQQGYKYNISPGKWFDQIL